MNNNSERKLLEVTNLRKYYPLTSGLLSRHIGDIKAVDGISFHIYDKEVFGLVGESGCGKSTLGRTVLKLEEPTDGKIHFDGKDITQLKGKALRNLRRDMQIVLQDPEASLDPRMTIGEAIAEPLHIHRIGTARSRVQRVAEIMEQVGIEPSYADRYPHEFSGGQRQRISLARSMVINPRLIVADEPVSALDVSVQAQILNLMIDLQQKQNLSYLFIAHDLAVVRHMAGRIAVMYLGNIVEIADREQLFNNPLHPYTQALISAISVPGKKSGDRIKLSGEVPSPANPPEGCLFHTRCHRVMKICHEEKPQYVERAPLHYAACHLYD